MPDNTEANKDLVRRWVEQVFNDADGNAVDDVVSPEFVEHALAPFGSIAPGKVKGPEHARATVEMLRRQFPDIRMHIDALVGDGDLVAALVTATGTHLGPLNPAIPATGLRFTAAQSHWFRVEGGRLVEHWATRDDLTSMRQLGVIPSPAGPPAHMASEPPSANPRIALR